MQALRPGRPLPRAKINPGPTVGESQFLLQSSIRALAMKVFIRTHPTPRLGTRKK